MCQLYSLRPQHSSICDENTINIHAKIWLLIVIQHQAATGNTPTTHSSNWNWKTGTRSIRNNFSVFSIFPRRNYVALNDYFLLKIIFPPNCSEAVVYKPGAKLNSNKSFCTQWFGHAIKIEKKKKKLLMHFEHFHFEHILTCIIFQRKTLPFNSTRLSLWLHSLCVLHITLHILRTMSIIIISFIYTEKGT